MQLKLIQKEFIIAKQIDSLNTRIERNFYIIELHLNWVPSKPYSFLWSHLLLSLLIFIALAFELTVLTVAESSAPPIKMKWLMNKVLVDSLEPF